MNATGASANSADRPAATAAICTISLDTTPRVASSPARAPPRMPVERMNIMSGPGAIMARKTAATYSASRCVFMSQSSHFQRAVIACQASRGARESGWHRLVPPFAAAIIECRRLCGA